MNDHSEHRAPFGRGRLRRIFGLDRTAPPPTQTRQGEPLRPFTIPNMVGYIRLAAIPVFLYIALDSEDGRSAVAATLFWLIAAGDYLDGFLARLTGQYSRMGALLDPVIDRLTILSGGYVCWHFELLPRWALVLLALREVATVALARHGLRRGIDLDINWLGRGAVLPIMAAIFFAMIVTGWVPDALLILGLVLAVAATILYARHGQLVARGLVQAEPHSP
jgi:cardiolipin synthase